MAQFINGFVYHTKYDLIDVIPRESLQNTGDNVLSLVRGLANATELHDTEVRTWIHLNFFYTYSFISFFDIPITGLQGWKCCFLRFLGPLLFPLYSRSWKIVELWRWCSCSHFGFRFHVANGRGFQCFNLSRDPLVHPGLCDPNHFICTRTSPSSCGRIWNGLHWIIADLL